MAFTFSVPNSQPPAQQAAPLGFGQSAPAFSFNTAPASSGAPASNAPAFGFGSQPAAASQSTPFGGFGTSTAPAASNLSFGQPAAGTTSAPFSFGVAPATTSAPFSFGAPAPTTSGALSFGAPAATTSSAFSFGAPAPGASTNLFGPQPAVTSQPQFSFSQPALPGGSLLGGSTSAPNSFTTSQPAFGAQQPGPAGPPAVPTIQDKLQALQAAWHPQSPLCRFQSFFYNVVDPAQVNLYAKPQMMRDALFQRAKRENPDPERRVVVLASSFDDIKRRVEAQTQMATTHFAKLNEVSAEVKKRSAERIEPALTRLQRASHAQVKLSARLMAVIAQLHPFTLRRGTPLRADEEKLANEITALHGDFANGPTRLPAMLNELWVQVSSRKAAAQAHASERDGDLWEVVNEEVLSKLLEVVDQQQRSLDYLTRTLTEDMASVNVIRSGFGLPRV